MSGGDGIIGVCVDELLRFLYYWWLIRTRIRVLGVRSTEIKYIIGSHNGSKKT